MSQHAAVNLDPKQLTFRRTQQRKPASLDQQRADSAQRKSTKVQLNQISDLVPRTDLSREPVLWDLNSRLRLWYAE